MPPYTPGVTPGDTDQKRQMNDLLEERGVAPLRTRFVIWPKRSIRVLVGAHLAEKTSMLSEVEAMVSGEDDDTVLSASPIFSTDFRR